MLSRIELSREALQHNLKVLRSLVGDCCLIAPSVKANAYGHGLVEVATAMGEAVNGFSVFSLAEAVALQEAGIHQPVLIMGPVEAQDYDEVVRRDLRIFVDSVEVADALAAAAVRQNRQARMHLKVDTGMARFGVRHDQLTAFLDALGHPAGLRIEGVATQAANAYLAEGTAATQEQQQRFKEVVSQVEARGYQPSIRHMANSSVTLRYPEMYWDMVRPGMACYGHAPVPPDDNLLKERGLVLQPVLSFKTVVASLKTVPAQTPVSYGGHFVTERESRLAVLPLGYSDGVSAVLTNIGEVLINGQRAPIRGRVCMNATVVDVTDIPGVARGDEVVILGNQGNETILADEWEEKVNRDAYAVFTGLPAHLTRLVV